MKFLAMAGILMFLGIGSTYAQATVGGAGSGPTVGGSSINNAGSINSSSAIGVDASFDPGSSKSVSATNPGEFVPSTFQNYPAAVTMGREGRMRPLTVVEAAKLAQQAKTANASKPTINLEKDAEGKLVIVDTKPVDSKPAQEKQ